MEEGLGGGRSWNHNNVYSWLNTSCFYDFAVVLVYILNLLGHFYQDIGLLIRLNHLFLHQNNLKVTLVSGEIWLAVDCIHVVLA